MAAVDAGIGEPGPGTRSVVLFLEDGSTWLARHWLAIANGFAFLVVGASVAVPAMMALGLSWLAGPIFASYRLICHQLPYRSFFPFGYQMAVCERDAAIYAAIAVGGMMFAIFRRVRPLSWRLYLALMIPIALDGGTQLFGLRESSWELRVVTGTLFGLASVWLAYPRLQLFAATILPGDGERTQDIQDGRR